MPLSTNLYCPESDVSPPMSDTSSTEWAPPLPARPISLLLASESDRALPHLTVESAADRHVAVEWILKVNEFYNFRPVTAYLSVDYLDRFLSSHSLPAGTEWPMQLAAAACLSVAAKMEETHVPLLPELQILAPRFMFESRTIGRMELLLMSALGWRMRPVTPFDFLDALPDHFPAELFAAARAALLSRAADLIVRTRRIVELLEFRPSVIAAAAIIHSADEIADFSAGEFWNSIRGLVDVETVKGCLHLMEKHLPDTCPSARRAAVEPIAPQSPIGVLDAAACGSCKSQKSSLPEPGKRRRLNED